MAALGVGSPSEYLRQLTARGICRTELRLLLNEIAVGETYMFRHVGQLEALRNVILPEIIEAKGGSGRNGLRFWCAGCSTGEESHTLAMTLLEEKDKLLADWTWEILATDLNDNSLETARAGIYSKRALRNTSEGLRKKYFKTVGEEKYQALDLVRDRIRFDRVNLSDDSQMLFQNSFDVIFCCNVLIYFDLDSKRRVVRHFYSNLLPGGYLFLGHAESLFHVDDTFRLVHFPGTAAYWKPAALKAEGGKS
jgi:chemotaxis protein methyltransferase CheR